MYSFLVFFSDIYGIFIFIIYFISSHKFSFQFNGVFAKHAGMGLLSHSLDESHLKWPLPSPRQRHHSLKPVSDMRSHSEPTSW